MEGAMKTYLSNAWRIFLTIILAIGMAGLPLHSARAGLAIVCTVTNASDGTAPVPTGSLREKIADTTCGSIIFDNDYTITLASALPDLGGSLLIDGTGHTIIVDGGGGGGGGGVRLFNITSAGNVTLQNLTIRNGRADYGAGIANSGTLTVTNSTLSHNSAVQVGGGIINSGTLTVTNSTLSQNSASSGGGIYIDSGSVTVTNSTLWENTTTGGFGYGGGGIFNFGTLVVTNSTLAGNAAAQWGGGIWNNGTLTLTNSTLAGNSAPGSSGGGIRNDATMNYANTIIANSPSGSDCVNFGAIGTNTNNLVGDGFGFCSALFSGNPKLDVLADNGGPTETMALLTGSPAIDAGDDATCAAAPVNDLDQRGVTRVTCDIGAYAYVPALTPTTTTLSSSANPSVTGRYIRFKATISPPEATGKLTFKDNGTAIPQCSDFDVDSRSVTCIPGEALTPGTHTITAVYSGDSTYSGSTGTLSPDQEVIDACTSPITVSSNADHGTGTLRQAIAEVCDGGMITFAASLSGGTIALEDDFLGLEVDMTIDGSALALPVTISGSGRVEVFGVGATVTLDSLKITNGYAEQGGGIFNGGNLTLKNSTLSGNRALDYGGGGIWNNGTLTVTNSTLSDNSAAYGAGILNMQTLILTNSTLSGNSSFHGTIDNETGTMTLKNSTLAGNTTSSGVNIYVASGTVTLTNTILDQPSPVANCSGTIIDGGHNIDLGNTCGFSAANGSLVNTDPLLGPLADNGGPTQTMALLTGSPAINAGDDDTCAAALVNNLDQRGVSRPQGPHCDIGAYESTIPNSFSKTSPTDAAAGVSTAPILSWESKPGADSYHDRLHELERIPNDHHGRAERLEQQPDLLLAGTSGQLCREH
jgi:hypothetical protein